MGAFASRRNHGVEEVDITTNNAYRYPPKSGCYFGSHFIMGGERFETTQPEAYLFGENQDLNFLGNRPVPFPYPAPQAHEPTKTLKSLVNIRKESVKFVRPDDNNSIGSKSPSHDGNKEMAEDAQSVASKHDMEVPAAESAVTELSTTENVDMPDESDEPTDPTKPTEPTTPISDPVKPDQDGQVFNIEFTFDTDVKCAITIYYFATEEISNKQAIYRPRDPSMNSETFHYKRGANQVFCQTTHLIQPSLFSEEEWQYNPDKEMIPIVIQCIVEEDEYVGHSHMTFATVEKVDGGYMLKALKQKQMVDGLCYLLQEIYGIENKNVDRPKDDDLEDYSSECVICLVEMRDTLILPCRHLCLCNCCADNLRYQASNCPICRSPFRALLQIRAMRKKMSPIPLTTNSSQTPDTSEETTPSQEGIPHGYEAISLIEALNGPATPTTTTAASNTSYPDGENPELDRLLADATERVTGSQPTSPEESPLMSRRRLRRKPSTSSNKSRQSGKGRASLEETSEVAEDLVPVQKSRNEVVMTDASTDTNKSPNKSKKLHMPRIKYSGGKSATKGPAIEEIRSVDSRHEDIKLNIEDETKSVSRSSSLLAANGSMDTAGSCGDSQVRRTSLNDYEYIDPADRERHTSEGDYEELDPSKIGRPISGDSTNSFKLDHQGALHVKEGDGDLSDVSLSQNTVGISSNPDGSGSSYSSTESTKGLLDHPDLAKVNTRDVNDPELC